MSGVTDLDRNPFELRQTQGLDGLYIHAEDMATLLRARAAQFSELAARAGDEVRRASWSAVSAAFAAHADQLDVAAIGCVTADPAPWVGGRNSTKEVKR